MHTIEAPVYGAVCRITWGGAKSTLSVSLLPSEEESGASMKFGVLAYSLPYREKAVTSILISAEDQSIVNSASQVSEMLAALLQRPVFVNTTLRDANVLLMSSIKKLVESTV